MTRMLGALYPSFCPAVSCPGRHRLPQPATLLPGDEAPGGPAGPPGDRQQPRRPKFHEGGTVIRLLRRSHHHVVATVKVDPPGHISVFDRIADAAHERDEEVTCGGSLRNTERGHYRVEVTAYRMSRRSVDALRDRIQRALDGRLSVIAVKHRCRCD